MRSSLRACFSEEDPAFPFGQTLQGEGDGVKGLRSRSPNVGFLSSSPPPLILLSTAPQLASTEVAEISGSLQGSVRRRRLLMLRHEHALRD